MLLFCEEVVPLLDVWSDLVGVTAWPGQTGGGGSLTTHRSAVSLLASPARLSQYGGCLTVVTGARLEQERNRGNMATHCSPRLDNGAQPTQEEEAGCDPPQLPVIVPNSVQGNVSSSSSSDPLDGEVPAVVSITRVPAKPKQPEGPPVGGLKVRTDLSAPKPGPPPLLRVTGGAPTRPALPPMPRLKLGGQRFPPQQPRERHDEHDEQGTAGPEISHSGHPQLTTTGYRLPVTQVNI